MTLDEFASWIIEFRKASGLTVAESEFVDRWFSSLQKVELADAMKALETVVADPRGLYVKHRQWLPLVLEHADEAKYLRERANRPPRVPDVRPPDPPGWKGFAHEIDRRAKAKRKESQ